MGSLAAEVSENHPAVHTPDWSRSSDGVDSSGSKGYLMDAGEPLPVIWTAGAPSPDFIVSAMEGAVLQSRVSPQAWIPFDASLGCAAQELLRSPRASGRAGTFEPIPDHQPRRPNRGRKRG